MRFLRLLLPFLAVSLLVVAAEAPSESGGSGTYRGRVLTERFRHRQAVARSVAALRAEAPAPVRQDQGEIAILGTAGGVVPSPNLFDLEGLTIRFTSSPDGYSSAPAPLAFDDDALANGVSLAFVDDDTGRVDLPFAFPYFGVQHRSLWVNSDGNITFGEGDAEVAARSIARAVSGPPRIAPLFADLDPSRPSARVRVAIRGDRVFITWDGVPPYSAFGVGRRQTVQAELAADGSVAFHYRTANLPAIVVGLFQGRLQGEPAAVNLSAGAAGPFPGGLAELFQLVRELDPNAAGQQFYRSHDDVYDFLVVFNDFGLAAGAGSFAYELNVRNNVLGIGDLLSEDAVFDYGADFGSPRRLASFLNMGPLSNYPSDPTSVIPLIGQNSTLSVLGQEAGHRWGAYIEFINPATGLPSSNLLGRDLAHWNFFFNSQASVLEGNEIVDHGVAASPRFETVAAVSRFSELDQYIMGLRAPAEVAPTFLVLNPRNAGATNPGRAPSTGVRFNGDRQDIDIGMIIAAEGPRLPDHTVAAREFRFAFTLVTDRAEPRAEDVAKLDRIRREWEAFFNQGVGQRAVARTTLVRRLDLSAAPAAGILLGGQAQIRIEMDEPLNQPLTVNLVSEGGFLTAPSQVVIPAGERSVLATVAGVQAGVAVLRASTSVAGFDSSVARVQVLADPGALTVEVESGAGQSGARGETLAEPVIFSVRDHNRLPYLGIEIDLTASDDGAAQPSRIVTGPDGLASATWRLPSVVSPARLRAAVAGRETPAVEVAAGDSGIRPSFSAEGVVNAASFNQGPAAELRGLSPGGLASIFGVGLATQTAAAATFPLPRILAGTTVRVNGLPAPLLLASPGQINFQIPFEITGPQAQIVVESALAEGAPVVVEVAATQPGVFTDSASGLAAILYASDGQAPWNRPARPGEFLQIFGTGLGAVSPRGETGEAASTFTLSPTLATPTVRIGGRTLTPTFSGLAPGFAGLYQVNVELPADLAPGPYELFLETPLGRSNAGLVQVSAP